MVRESLKEKFLHSCNLGKIERIQLKGDASFRRYERIIAADQNFILMDAPPEHEETIPFINIANFLLNHELSSPQIIASNSVDGFILLEDFGNESYNSILSGKSELSSDLTEERLYIKAIDCLIHLHKIPEINIDIPQYSTEKLLAESNQFIDWYVATLNGEVLSADQIAEYNGILENLINKANLFPNVVVHRDYHADNLMWLNDRISFRKVGILDFQDAVTGSVAYDLVSLLEDARRDVHPHLAEEMITHYLKAFPDFNRKDFNLVYAVYGIQRNLKIVGFCARQATKHKNPIYLSLLPRVWRYINHDLKHPLLLPLKQCLTKIVPTQIK